MVKKIIVLAISFVLAIGSLVSYNVINDEAVEFGAGAGVSRTINSVSELSDVLSKIPSFEEYSENANISDAEGREEFSGITVVETGYVSTYDGYRRGIRLPKQDEENENLYKSRNQTLKNHRLEMSFAPNAVYYHSIGTMWNAVEYYVYEEPQDSSSSYEFTFYNEDFALAMREKTDYDVEIYHAQDRTMFKINSYETVTQRATKIEENKKVYVDYEEEVEESDEDLDTEGQMMANLANEMIKIREKNYGVWIEYPRAEEGEGEGEPTEPEDPFAGLDPDNMTEEQQKEFYINMLVQQFSVALTEVAYQDLITVQQAHASNKAYLGRLAGYIADKASDGDYFKRKGNSYDLKGPKYVEAVYGSEGELLEDGYTDYTVPDSYMSGVAGLSAYHGNGSGANTNFDFNVGSDMVSVNQKINTWTKYNKNDYNTNTTIMYIDNTVVNLSKNAKIITLDEAYVQPFNKIITDAVNKMEAQQGGNE